MTKNEIERWFAECMDPNSDYSDEQTTSITAAICLEIGETHRVTDAVLRAACVRAGWVYVEHFQDSDGAHEYEDSLAAE